MLRLKTFKMFALFVCLFSMAQLLNAESFNEDAIISLMQDGQLMRRKNHKVDSDDNDNKVNGNCKNRVKPLRLKDFEGAWVFTRETLGGLGGETSSTGTPSVGSAVIIDGQVVFDRNGHGVVNFASSAQYNGTPGDITNITASPGEATVTLTITDPVNGIGMFAVSDPLRVFEETADLVAIRSKSTGCVLKFIGHRTSVPTRARYVTRYIVERQLQ